MLDRSREFIELAIQLNFTTAAERLHLSISALSRHMSDLEAELGVTLFNRSPLSLTPAGEAYLESISTIVNELDAAIDKCRRIDQARERPFTVYILPMQDPAYQVFYESAALLRQKSPGFVANFCVDDRLLTNEEAVLEGKADVGVVYEKRFDDDSQVVLESIGCSPLCVWVLKSSPLAKRESVSFSDLAEYFYPISTNRQSHTGADATRRMFADYGVDLKTRLRNIERYTGFYITLRPDEFFIAPELDSMPLRVNPDLVQIPFDVPLSRMLYLAYRRDAANPELLEYVATCKQLAQQKGLA